MDFVQIVWDNYSRNKREFAWRHNPDPYAVLVSEVMLQQTQTKRVEEKFPVFIAKFPSSRELANASLSAVLQEWQGMGYNRRGKFLHEAAKKIEVDFDGKVPRSPEELLTLPGVGAYTSCSIATFAYNIPTTFIETNIRTVYLYHFFSDREDVHDKEILELISTHVDPKNPRDWYYALMDYGVHLKQSVGNLNATKSKQYRKQSKFEGSNRQVRATILKYLLESRLSEGDLRQKFPPEENRIQKNLHALVNEGMIKKRGNLYTISQID